MTDVDITSLELIDPDLLPTVARRLVKVIGLPESLKLLKARGGLPTRMPRDGSRCEVLDQILCNESLQALSCSDLAGLRLDLPKLDKALLQIRNHAIGAARETLSAAKTARLFNLTRRQVINITGNDEDPTGDLFEACDSAASGAD